MKISADSGPSGNHILLCPIWFFRMPASPKLKEMRLTLYPCMPFNSNTSYVHCNILNKSDNLMLFFVCDYCLQYITRIVFLRKNKCLPLYGIKKNQNVTK